MSLPAVAFSAPALFYSSEHLAGWYEFHGPLVPSGVFTASQSELLVLFVVIRT